MPYLQHFDLHAYPFSITPNRDLFFSDGNHDAVLHATHFAIQRGDGIIKVSGEVGTGKTLICRLLMDQLANDFSLAYILAPQPDHNLIARQVCGEFNLKLDLHDDPFRTLHTFLLENHDSGKPAVLVIDEAQALGPKGLETVRLLSNLETDDRKLLQIVMFGQPELDQYLNDHGLRQLAQRITFNFSTQPFAIDEALRYMQHRIAKCSNAGPTHQLFSRSAAKLVAAHSYGIPRLINTIADKALVDAYAKSQEKVKSKNVLAAIAESPCTVKPIPWHLKLNPFNP